MLMTKGELEHFWQTEVLIFGAMYGYLRKPQAIQRLDAAIKHIARASLVIHGIAIAETPEQVHRESWALLRAAHKMVQEGAV